MSRGKKNPDRPAQNRPSRLFVREGYSISCRLDGLEIRAVEYHAGVLRLSWTDLKRLMVESGLVPPTANDQSEDHDRPQVH